MRLSKLYEEKFLLQKKSNRWASTFSSNPSTTSRSSFPRVPVTSLTSHPSPRPEGEVRKLTPDDIQLRRKQNIYFACDEKWFRGHKCKVKHIFLLEGLLDVNEEVEEASIDPASPEDETV